MALFGGDQTPRPEFLHKGGERIVPVLHHQQDHRALTPPPQPDQLQNAPPTLFTGLVEQLEPPRPTRLVVGEECLQRRNGVGSLAISDWFDVRVGRRVEGRGDRDALGEILRRVVGTAHRTQDRFGVGAGQHAQRLGKLRQRTPVLGQMHDLLGVERTGGDDHLTRGQGPAARTDPSPRRRPSRVHLPAAVCLRIQPGDRGAVENRRAA